MQPDAHTFGAGSVPDPSMHFALASKEAEVELDHDGIELGVDEAQHGSEHEMDAEGDQSLHEQHAAPLHEAGEPPAHQAIDDGHPHALDGMHFG